MIIKNLNPILFRLLMAFLLVTFPYVQPALAQAVAKRKIGVSLGLTGNLATIGVALRNAILLAQEENDPSHEVEFLFEDDSFDPKRTVAATMKFIDQDKVDGLIVFGSGTALAVNNLAEAKKIPMIALGNSKKIIAGKKYVMMHFLDTDTENEVVVQEVKQRPYKRIAVICSSQDAMLDLSNAFKKALPERVALSMEILPSDTDFRSVVARIKSSNADAVYNILLPGPTALFAKQLRELGYNGELFSAHAVDDWNQVTNYQGALIGTWFVTGNVIKDNDFVHRYQAVFHDTPKVATPNGYDAAKIFIEAAHAPDMNAYLHQLKDFHGVMGTYGLNPSGYFELSAALRKITASGFEPL